MGSASGSPESKDSESLSQQQAAFAPETQTPHLYPHWPWTLPARILRTLVLEAITRPLIAIFLNPRIVPPAQPLPDGPFLVIANHVTSLDGALVLYALPPRLRHRLAVAMSGEMLLDFRLRRNQPNAVAGLFAPAAYWLLTLLFNVFPLPRLRGFQRSFSHAGQALDSGQSVLIFPEGTRYRSETILAPFRPGIGLLATEASVPVLPVALAGMPILHTGLRNWFRSGRLAVRIGPPITLPAIATPAEWTAELEAAMRSLLAETCTLNK
jgi:long-chain acyl-CoA synthetase